MSLPRKIAVASGKGGTGKTTVAINLFHFLIDEKHKQALLVDCDVEEPNSNLFLKGKEIDSEEVYIKVPYIKTSKCVYCGKCYDYCAFNAIMFVKELSFLKVMEDLCHGCGACSYACKYNAIEEKDKTLGKVNSYEYQGRKIIEGELNVGVATPVPVINAARKKIDQQAEVVIYDAPPGTSCPAVATVEDADYVILVGEPTPFGLNDLKISVEAFKKMGKQMGVVINKSGLGDRAMYDFLEKENIPVLAEIPFTKEIAETISNGEIFIKKHKEYRKIFEKITGFINI